MILLARGAVECDESIRLRILLKDLGLSLFRTIVGSIESGSKYKSVELIDWLNTANLKVLKFVEVSFRSKMK